MKKIKVYHAGQRGSGYSSWVPNRELVNSVEEADLVFCNGGADVDPRLYGATKGHPNAWGHSKMENDEELHDITKAISLGKKLWGTCKGIQYGVCVSGGKMVADISHPGSHKILTEDGKSLSVNSMHHMLCWPFNLPKDKYRVIGWAENLSRHHEDADGKEMETPVEPEILYFPETKFLGSQFHPEAMSSEHPTVIYCKELLEKFMEDKL